MLVRHGRATGKTFPIVGDRKSGPWKVQVRQLVCKLSSKSAVWYLHLIWCLTVYADTFSVDHLPPQVLTTHLHMDTLLVTSRRRNTSNRRQPSTSSTKQEMSRPPSIPPSPNPHISHSRTILPFPIVRFCVGPWYTSLLGVALNTGSSIQ